MGTERPILFSAQMVRSLLEGRKTQTRRVVKLRGAESIDETDAIGCYWPWSPEADDWAPCPYGRPGDRLWVKETWATPPANDAIRPSDLDPLTPIRYAADGVVCGVSKRFVDADGRIVVGRTRPSIFMPRWASRITLKVAAARVERLHDISETDAVAEGVDLKSEAWPDYPQAPPLRLRPRYAFELIWSSINGAESWAANPWVWVVSFKRVTP